MFPAAYTNNTVGDPGLYTTSLRTLERLGDESTALHSSEVWLGLHGYSADLGGRRLQESMPSSCTARVVLLSVRARKARVSCLWCLE